MIRTATPSLLLIFLSVLVWTGCDSGMDASDGPVLVPNTSSLDFQTERGESDTLRVTLVYRDLDERPAIDGEVNSVYTVTLEEETGSPQDGSSTYAVVFVAPQETGSYAQPVVFRSGGTSVTVRFAGLSIGGAEPITDFSGSETGFTSFNGAINLSLENEQLRADMTSVGGSGVFPGMFTTFESVINFEPTPVVAVRMMATASSESSVRIRAALNQEGDLPDANPTVPELLATVPNDGEYRTYYFDFRDNFVQFDGQAVNPANIKELVFLFNDNIDATFTGTLYMDVIERMPDIPDDADPVNQAPTADFTFSPQFPTTGETVTFTDASSDADGTVDAYAWDFGDGSTGTGTSPSHTYAQAGTYTVTLTVTDDAGATAEASASITVEDPGGSGDTIVFDDFEDGLQENEYFTFAGGGAGITLAIDSDVPTASSGTSALRADVSGGTDGFVGYGKTRAANLSGLGSDPYLNFYVRTDAASAFTLEINLQEDQDGNGTFDGSGAVDDEFQFNYDVQPSAGDYTLVSIPISAFTDDNAVNNGGDGTLSDTILNIVVAIGGVNDASHSFWVDDIVYSTNSLGGTSGN